ncbi:MAG: DUF481 domain-containing protein [Phycisphaerales bacterium]|nr:DUF481 domain-containing protein [Phycisphaerales bacterium]
MRMNPGAGVVVLLAARVVASEWELGPGPAAMWEMRAGAREELRVGGVEVEELDAREASISMTPQPAAAGAETAPPASSEADSFWKGWKGSIEGGLNGSDGNSESLNIRAGLNMERKAEAMETTLHSQYTFATADGDKDKNRWFNELRNDWLLGREHRWSFFALGQLEYDDFQDWNWRMSGFAGPGYKLIKTDKTTLNGRAGAGVTKYAGGSRNELIPEGLLAMDVAHQLTERQKLTGAVEYYPSFRQFSDYRIVARAGWEIVVDPEVNMMLKIGAEDRYDSDPGEGFKKNDIDYFMLIGWKF